MGAILKQRSCNRTVETVGGLEHKGSRKKDPGLTCHLVVPFFKLSCGFGDDDADVVQLIRPQRYTEKLVSSAYGLAHAEACDQLVVYVQGDCRAWNDLTAEIFRFYNILVGK
jgi:hypothetical protein